MTHQRLVMTHFKVIETHLAFGVFKDALDMPARKGEMYHLFYRGLLGRLGEEVFRPVRLGNCLLVNKLLSFALLCVISMLLEK